MRRTLSLIALLGLSLLALPALAQDSAWVTANANLRAGPDSGYPRIVTIPAGMSVQIYGCVDDWSWCDVYWRGERGWISAGLLEYTYSGNRVGVYDYGARIGLPILSFVFGSYWDDHYRNRQWYDQRNHWQAYHPPPRPRPIVHPSQPRPPQNARPPQHQPRPPQQNRPPQPGNQRPPPGQGAQQRPAAPMQPKPQQAKPAAHRPPEKGKDSDKSPPRPA